MFEKTQSNEKEAEDSLLNNSNVSFIKMLQLKANSHELRLTHMAGVN